MTKRTSGRTKEEDTPYRREYRRLHRDKDQSYKLRTIYGITLDDYNRMFAEQEGKCKVCGRHQTEFKQALCVDHNHETGKIRGLLCLHCNTTLGNVSDDIDILHKLVEYLEERP